MPFDDGELAKQIGFLTINIWRLSTAHQELSAEVAALKAKYEPPKQEEPCPPPPPGDS